MVQDRAIGYLQWQNNWKGYG